jgi:hypothetical protein
MAGFLLHFLIRLMALPGSARGIAKAVVFLRGIPATED